MPDKKQNTPFIFQGTFRPGSVNESQRTADVIWYSGARVKRWSWEGPYELELSLDPAHVCMERLSSGTAPLLNSHSEWSIGDVIGVIEKAEIQGGQGVATVRFSKRADVEPIWQDVKDGILRNISMGAEINEVKQLEEAEGKMKVYRAEDWEPYEVSLVPIGADPNARTFAYQSADDDPLEKIIKGGHRMNKEKLEATTEAAEAASTAAEEAHKAAEEAEAAAKAAEEAAAAAADAAEAADDAATVVEEIVTEEEEDDEPSGVSASRKGTMSAERKRVQQIMKMAAQYELGDAFIKLHIDKGTPTSKIGDFALTELARKNPTVSGISVGATEDDKRGKALSEAILHRVDPKYKLSDQRNPYAGRSLVEMARAHLSRQGLNLDGMYPYDVAKLALAGRTGLAAYHTRSDFPLILGNTINRRLRDDYKEIEPTWQGFTSRATAPDFREMNVVSLGEVSQFKKVKESEEYTYGTLGETGAKYAVEKSGLIIALSFEAMVNDDLNAFGRVPRRIASAARRFESDAIYGILVGNPVMADGEQLFSINHGNIAATGSDITDAALTAARVAMRTQTSPGSSADNPVYLDIYPRFLIIGPQMETLARKMLSNEMLATKTADINIWKGSFDLVVDPRITGKQWLLAADPAMFDTIEYAYLEGEEGLYTEYRNGFEVDGLELKARLIFGTTALDYRGLYYNPGA